jgi:hypothetical protein
VDGGTERVSRRELLRSIGITGAAAWASPVLTGRRASAATDRCTKKKSRRLCRGDPCCDDPCTCGSGYCGTCTSDVGDGSFCFIRNSDLRCYCAEDVFCSEAGHCVTDADCKAQNIGRVQHAVLHRTEQRVPTVAASAARQDRRGSVSDGG